MKLFFIRRLKSLFIWMHLHVIFKPFTGIFLNLVYLTKLSAWASGQKTPVNDFWSRWDYEKRYPFYDQILGMEKLDGPINYLEFGVAAGASFQWWLKKNNHQDSQFHGFDTFSGLPEDWGPYKKGAFGTGNQVPVISDARGKFHTGLFQQTLPAFLKTFQSAGKNVIMMDADLFSATLYVLSSLAPFLKKGDVIFFDEFVVPTHEYMAFHQFVQSFYINLELVGAANNYYFTAFRVA